MATEAVEEIPYGVEGCVCRCIVPRWNMWDITDCPIHNAPPTDPGETE